MAATQCEMEHGKVVENVDGRRGGGGREMGEEARGMRRLQVDAQGGGTAGEG